MNRLPRHFAIACAAAFAVPRWHLASQVVVMTKRYKRFTP
jgi:hypothetical protein